MQLDCAAGLQQTLRRAARGSKSAMEEVVAGPLGGKTASEQLPSNDARALRGVSEYWG